MSGPPPIPTERKRALGNPGHQKLPAVHSTAPIAPAIAAPRPARKLTASGMRLWRRMWTFGGAWISPGTDLEIATRYVELVEMRAECAADVPRERRIVEGSQGQSTLNPLLKQWNTLNKDILAIERALGFTPADRSRIGAAEVRAASSLDKLNERREARAAERAMMRNDSG